MTLPDDRGIISILSDYFVDLDFLHPQPTIQSIPDTIPLTTLCEDTESQHQPESPMIHSSLLVSFLLSNHNGLLIPFHDSEDSESQPDCFR
jgi:hypothetical protein